jgi:NADPH-dependent 2,4-dienoyl-CoA reductase/sulfur reductase-like enzyme/predicted CoA-binding protein
MKKYDVIVVGGGPAGIISAVTAKKYYPDKNILLVKNIEKGVIPCGIPYMFYTLKDPQDNFMGNAPLEKNNIELRIDEVIKIDRQKNIIITKNNEEYKYKKLILALGSNPIVPQIDGINTKGIYGIIKEMDYLKNLKEEIKKSKNIVIIGGGFIGVEFADELSNFKDLNVSVVEFLPNILGNSFDIEFSDKAKEELIKKNVKIYTNVKAEKINGNGKAESVLLSDGSILPADIVILGIGSRPNIALAEDCRLKTSKKGISVDKNLKTSDKNIFAIGDCSEKRDFFTKETTNVMLASTATTQARIAGCNLFEKFIINDTGTIASYSTKINELCLGSTGMTEKTAIEKGFKIVTGIAQSPDKHPEKLPNSSKVTVKLIFSELGIILGGQISGGDSIGEMINVVSIAIQNKWSLMDLEKLQISTHPKLTPAPTTYPIINAAQNALQKFDNKKHNEPENNKIINEFLNKKNIFAVVGVSRDPEKYGNKVYADLKNAGYIVYPINPKINKIFGNKCFAELKDLPKKPDVVNIVVSPEITETIVKECKKLGINKVWMQPGSQSEESINYCKKNKINLLHDVCVMIERGRR